jgi:hypothetical protein
MKAKISDALQMIAAILITTGMVAYAAPVPQTHEKNTQSVVKAERVVDSAPVQQSPSAKPEMVKNDVSDPNHCEPEQYWAKEPPYQCLPKPKTSQPAAAVTTTSPPASATDNETIIWNYLVSQGFSRNQVAGIMGNLQQEHNFNTSDTPGGLGIAQWIGGRRANLIAQGNYLDINVQLNFLMSELNGVESAAGNAIRGSGSVEGATVAFQNLFERCGMCHEGKRINYAYSILGRH